MNAAAQPAEIAVAYRPIDDLKMRDGNPRTHSDYQVRQIMASITEFGFTNPLLVDEAGVLIAGHGRYRAAQRLGLKHVPTIELTKLSAAQIRAYVIADNKLAINGGWDMDLLSYEIDQLKATDFDVSLLGFSMEDLQAISMNTTPGAMPELNAGDKSPIEQMTFTLHKDQAERIRQAMEAAAELGEYGETGNENRNGNALARVADYFMKGWVEK